MRVEGPEASFSFEAGRCLSNSDEVATSPARTERSAQEDLYVSLENSDTRPRNTPLSSITGTSWLALWRSSIVRNNYESNVDLDSASNLDLDSASNLDSVNREDSNALLVLDWNTVSLPCGHGMLGTPEVPWASIAGRDQLYLQDGRLLGAAISDLTWNDASLPMVDRNHGLPWADVHAGHRCHHIGSSSTRLAASGAIRVAVLPGDIWTWEEDPRTEAAVTLWRVHLADKSPYVESMEAVLEVVVADDGGGSIIEGSEGGGIWETDPDHLVLMFKTRGGYYGEGQVRWKKTGAAHPFTLIPPANTSLHTSVVLSISFDEVSWGRALGTASAAYMDIRVACSSDLFAVSIQASGSVWVRDCVNASALVVDDVSLSGDGGVVWAVLPAGEIDIVWSRKVGAALSVDCLFDEEDESLIVALHFGTFSTHFEMVTFDQSLSSSVVALPASGENVVIASRSSLRTPGNALIFRGMCNAVLGTYSEVRLASSLLLSIRGDSSFPGLVWLAGSDQLEVPENAVAVIGCDNNSSTCTSACMNVVSLHNCSLDRAIMAAGISDSGLFMLMVSIKDIVDPRAVRIGCSSSGNRSFSIEHLCSGTGGGGVLALQLPGHSSSLKLPCAAMEALGGVYLSGNRQVFSPSVGGAGLVLAAPDADVGIVASGDVHLRSTLGRVRISSDIVAERDCHVLGSSCFLGPTSFEAPSAFNEELVVDGDLFVNRSMSARGSVFLDGPVSMAPLGPPVRLSDNALTEVGQIVFRDDGCGFSLVGRTYADEEDPRLLFEGLSHPDTAQRYDGRAQMGDVGGGKSLVDAAWMYADGMETRDHTVGTFLRLSKSIKLHAGQKLRASVDASGGVLVLANDGDSRFPLTVSGDAPSDLVQAAFGSSISRPPVAPLPSYTGMRLESGGGDLVILGGEGGGVMQVSDVGVALDLNPAGGLVRVNGVPIQSTSDGRQKTNRSDLLGTSSADILRRLRQCTYTHRGVVEAGFIAQEVFCEVPEMRHLISLPRDFEIDDDNTLGNAPVGSVGLNYVGIIAYLVSAMQEQAKKIEDLQARISHGVVVPGLTSNIVNAPYPPLSGIRAQSGTSGLPSLSFSNAPDTGLFNPSVGTLGVVAGGAELVRVSNNVSVLADIVVSSNIIPVKNATQHIGSSNMHFKEAWIDTLHISSNTLYVGDTLVLGIEDQTLAMSSGPGKGISITTTGAGEEGVNVTSVGGVTMHVTGINKVVDIQSTGADGIVQLGATKEVVLTAPITTVSSNLTVNGNNFTAGIRANSGSAGAPSLSFSNATDTGLFNPGAGMLGVVAGGEELVRVSNTVSVMGNLVVSSNIIPSANATQYIGSSTMHFKEVWINTLHISSNTLYIGDTAVLGTDDQTVSIRADPGQGISITTTGVGETSLVSESGVNVVAGGGVNMQVTGLNKVVDIQSSGAGGTVQFGATKEVVITTPLTTVSNNLNVSGNLTVNGSNFTVNTQTVTVEDNIILLNSGEVGPGVTKGEAGITIDRGDELDYQLLFRESDDKFVMGPQGSLVPIATETFAANAGNISTGVLGVIMGGTGVSASTGTGSNVLRDNATMSNLTTIGGMISSNGLYGLGADKIGISTGGVSRVTILDNGNVGFGTNAPESRLHVVGDGYFNGNLIATSNIIGFSTMESDSNVKHHFEPITDALDKIDAIGAYTFEYRGDDSRKMHAGVIAQQVQRVLPEVVDVHPLKDTLTVAYGNLSSLLLAGVQELRDEVNNLKEELKEIHCVLFENGGTSYGAYVGVRDVASGIPKLGVRGGLGGTVPHANIVYVDVYPIPADDLTHEIAFEFRTDPTEGVRVWIDGTLYGEDTGSFHNGIWSGSGPGSFGRVETTFAVGESSNPWPVSITKPLRSYDNQLGWLSAMEANLGTPDYVYSGPSTFESLTLSTDTMFSMDVVIPTNFATSCILFDYGGAGHDIAHEYGLSTTQPVALDSFYQNQPAITTGIWDTRRSALARKAFVGRLGTPNVPSDGSLSLLAFRGGRRKPPALAREIVTVPPQMNGFAEDVATELFAASFANTTQAQMESDGWIFNTDNVLTFESTLARSNSSYNIAIEPKDGSARALRAMNGFTDGILGEFISLRIPWPIYLTSYEKTGSCTDWVVYGSVDGKSFDVLDTQIGYLRGFYSEVLFVSSDVDGREYLLRRLPDRQNAANLMARINSNLNKLVQHLVAKYPKNKVVRQLYDNYNPDALSEGGAELGYTSYSVNKGEKIVLCLRQRDHELVEENILMYVAIHELGHLATDEVGHTPKFWSNFKWILGEAMSIGLYTKVDFDNEPKKYCGINITSSIV
eukprot:gene4136-biopygen21847